jgi:hypothetical protein
MQAARWRDLSINIGQEEKPMNDTTNEAGVRKEVHLDQHVHMNVHPPKEAVEIPVRFKDVGMAPPVRSEPGSAPHVRPAGPQGVMVGEPVGQREGGSNPALVVGAVILAIAFAVTAFALAMRTHPDWFGSTTQQTEQLQPKIQDRIAQQPPAYAPQPRYETPAAPQRAENTIPQSVKDHCTALGLIPGNDKGRWFCHQDQSVTHNGGSENPGGGTAECADDQSGRRSVPEVPPQIRGDTRQLQLSVRPALTNCCYRGAASRPSVKVFCSHDCDYPLHRVFMMMKT